jgi:hypothetical protein
MVKTASGLFNDVTPLMKMMTIYIKGPDACSSPEWATQAKKSILLASSSAHQEQAPLLESLHL